MAKKRKTRNQKEKSTQKRPAPQAAQSQSAKNTSAKSNKPAKTSPKSEQQASTTPVSPDTEKKSPEGQLHASRMRTMRWSLMVFIALIAIQLFIWILEYFDVITLDLIEV